MEAAFSIVDGAAGRAAFWELHDRDGQVVTMSESFRSVEGLDAARALAEADVEVVRQAVLEATPARDLLAHLQERVNGKAHDGSA